MEHHPSVLKFVFWTFMFLNWIFICMQVCECVFTHLSCNRPLWGCYEACWEESRSWHLWCAETCWRFVNI